MSRPIKGTVLHFSPGKEGIPGIKIDGVGWRNAPKGSNLLSQDLEGQEVEIQLEDVLGDGTNYITQVKPQHGSVRVLNKDFEFTNSVLELKAKKFVGEWFIFYQEFCKRLVSKPAQGEPSYLKSEKESLAAKHATSAWVRYREEKSNSRTFNSD